MNTLTADVEPLNVLGIAVLQVPVAVRVAVWNAWPRRAVLPGWWGEKVLSGMQGEFFLANRS